MEAVRCTDEPVGRQETGGADALADAGGDRHRALASRVGQDERELVAAEPGDDVGFTRAARMIAAASTSALLPARCPWLSLTLLNPSRSRNSSDSGRPLRDGALGFPAQRRGSGSASYRAG